MKIIMGNLTAIFQIITVELTIIMLIYTISKFLNHHWHAEGISFPMMYHIVYSTCTIPVSEAIICRGRVAKWSSTLKGECGGGGA